MEISPRKPSKRAQEPIDEWLQAEGFFRKHAPRDSTCLFRAVSEQVYKTQRYHIKVRKECVEFMREMKHLFAELITIPFDDYLDQMACFTQWGGLTEIQAMSLLYKKEFVIFNSQNQANRVVTNNGFKDTIYLCQTSQKQYECIYTQSFVASAAYCQSIIYKLLYKNVFQMGNVDTVVDKMLHDRTTAYRHDKFFHKDNLEIREQLAADVYNKIENSTDETDNTQIIRRNNVMIPPFPYKIAKALDPNIYRNTDFDVWQEIRKEVKGAGWVRYNSNELQIGGKCLIQMDFFEPDDDKANNNANNVLSLENDPNDHKKALQKKTKDPVCYYGHIQEISKNEGPVLVFIEELGEKRVVPYGALKPLPPKKNKEGNWLPANKKNLALDSSQKWKKACSPQTRKIKDSTNVLSNNVDKSANNNNDVNKSNFDWKDESVRTNGQTYENYPVEKCSNYSINNSVKMFPAGTVFDNSQVPVMDVVRQENGVDHKDKGSYDNTMSNNTSNNSVVPYQQYCKQTIPQEVYYPPYIENSNVQMDHMILPVNCTVQKSVDINGSDLPLSDPHTLRFFYNLGLEYFHNGANYHFMNGPSTEQWHQGDVPPTEEVAGMMQNCTLTQPEKEHENGRKEIVQSMWQENGNKCTNDAQIQKTEIPKEENGKDVSYVHYEKATEEESVNKNIHHSKRNGVGLRFKKNSGRRYRPIQKGFKMDNGVKGNATNIQYSNHQQVQHTSADQTSYQTTYMQQQGMHSGVPYYVNGEAEAFANPYCPPNPGYIPIQCLSAPDVSDINNIPAFPPHPYVGMDYTQAYSGPYLCGPPPPAPYNVAPQNMSEHWYALAGQPHYVPYAPMLPITAETNCNGPVQNGQENVAS